MSFPTATTALTTSSANTTSAVVNLPGSIVAGKTLLVLIRTGLGGTVTFPAGWTELFEDSSDSSDDTTALAWRRADGAEGATVTVTLGTSSKFEAISWLITGARNPELNPPEISNITFGVGTTLNPGSLTPTGGAQNYLWFWMGGFEGATSPPPHGNPANYTSNIVEISSTSDKPPTNGWLFSATRQLNAATEDPGTWAVATSTTSWTAVTVAVYPEVTTENTETKDLGYVVDQPNTEFKGLDYEVETTDIETMGLDYLTEETHTPTLPLSYRLPPLIAPARIFYSVIIKDSAGNLTEFEKISSLSYELYENEVGVCRFLLPYSDSKLTPASVEAGKGIIRIYRAGVLVWQGFVSVIENSKDGSTIYGFDFKETLKWYRVGMSIANPQNNEYIDKKIGSQIISPIWDIIAARTNPFLGSVVAKGTIQNPYDLNIVTLTDKRISRTVADEDFFSFLQEMVAVSRADSPVGSRKQDTVFDISLSESNPTFTFLRDVGVDKPEVRLELDSEITNFMVTEDSSRVRNSIRGLTVTDAPKVLQTTQTDTASRDEFYLRDIGIVFPSADKQESLVEKTKDYLKEHKDVRPAVSLEFASGLKPFDGYSMGDGVRVVINRGRVEIDEFYKVVGMRVGYEAGVELTVPILRRKRT